MRETQARSGKIEKTQTTTEEGEYMTMRGEAWDFSNWGKRR